MRTSLASKASSRTHFEDLGLEGQVLGVGLEASFPRKLPCLRLEDSTIFESLKFCTSPKKIFGRRFFLEIARKKFLKTFFFENICACVLGPWPQEGLSSEGLSLALHFFCVLGLDLELCVLDSTSDITEKAKK